MFIPSAGSILCGERDGRIKVFAWKQ